MRYAKAEVRARVGPSRREERLQGVRPSVWGGVVVVESSLPNGVRRGRPVRYPPRQAF
jgi:hypothetical protein